MTPVALLRANARRYCATYVSKKSYLQDGQSGRNTGEGGGGGGGMQLNSRRKVKQTWRGNARVDVVRVVPSVRLYGIRGEML
jgi:hypothetical protein